MGLTGAVVRILTDDHHLDLIQRRGIQRIEDQRARRVNLLACSFLCPQELTQRLHVGFVELLAQCVLPTGFELDVVIGHANVLRALKRMQAR